MMRHPIVFVLDNLRSRYNVGAFFRLADAVRAEKIYLCGTTPLPRDDRSWDDTKRIEKTALGTTKTVPWKRYDTTVKCIKALRSRKYQIVVAEEGIPAIHYDKAEFKFPVALVFGNEVEGIDQKLLPLADFAVSIPMYGTKNSLNVAVAAGILAYHVLKIYQS